MPVGPTQRLAKQELRKRVGPCRVSLVVPGPATSPEFLPDGERLRAGATVLITSSNVSQTDCQALHHSILSLFSQRSDPYAWLPCTPGSWLQRASPGAQGSLRPRGPVPYLPVYRARGWGPWVRQRSEWRGRLGGSRVSVPTPCDLVRLHTLSLSGLPGEGFKR